MSIPFVDNDVRQEDEVHVILPDLNVDVAHEVPDLNLNPNSPLVEVSPTTRFVIDLNNDPHFEDDTHVEVELQTSVEFVANIDENVIDENGGEEFSQESNHRVISKNLSNDERQAVYNMLLQQSVDGKLKRGVTRMVATQFSISIRTVQRIWKQSIYGNSHNVSHRRTRNCGRKRVEINNDQIREIPLNKRTTIRSLACAVKMPKSTLFRRLKSGDLRRHSNAIKPFLKEENKISRLQFCLSMLDRSSIPHDPTFIGMYNIVHIDEKWFYMTKKTENYYLLQDEEEPLRTCKSKNFIGKVMFLVAIARPRFDAQGKELFSGKIGVFPFVTHEPAKRSSVNRVAGTLETKPIPSVKKEIVRSYLIEKVLPAIKEKWPIEDSMYPIFIQQDNARTHIDHNDDLFCQAATEDGFDIRLMSQPPNSPDLNVLDLGFFSAIQSLQYKESPKTVDELISAVERSFQAFPATKSNRIFLTLQSCMIEIMRAKGSHNYKIPHIKKAMLERMDQLPSQLKCNPELVQEVYNYLS